MAKVGQVFAGSAERPAAVIPPPWMFLLLYYLVMGVRSFRTALRAPSGA